MTIRLLVLSTLAVYTPFDGLVSITNSSFESPIQGDGNFTGSATGWVVSGAGGVWDPSAGNFASIPDGVQVGYLNSGGTLTQSLGIASIIGFQYTLDGWIGNRSEAAVSQTGTIELLFGATPVITLSTNPPDGFFVNLSGSFVAASAAPISIRLSTTGTQSNFDAISLNAVPEPGAFALVGLGLVALGYWRRCKTA